MVCGELFCQFGQVVRMAAVIRKLDETVVNRIAAGEVIQRPSNALKELIENSLDAKATAIQIVVSEGGLKFLQIQDNGTGIRKEDLDIVCERFTTSKLKEYDDLKEIATYGFRGEALASISHVARLSIVTRTNDSKCAFKATYIDSKPQGPPKPCAANVGTQIIIEDLFYNIPTRRKAFKNVSEEYAKIVEVVSHYAIHNATVGFSLKKKDGRICDVQTNQNSTQLDNIRNIYTRNLASELLEVNDEDGNYKYKLHGFISNASYSIKKGKFLLFINNRLVDCTSLRKGITNIYSAYLPKNTHSFSYLSLQIAPNNVDVNVHPTKHEVKFLHEDIIVEKIQKIIDSKLLGCHSSRTLYTQKLLPTDITGISETTSQEAQPPREENKRVYDHQNVRTDSKIQKLDSFFNKPTETSMEMEVVPNRSDGNDSGLVATPAFQRSSDDLNDQRQEIRLKSVLTLQQHIKDESHSDLRKLFKSHTFVGCIDREFALIQYETKLYLINTSRISELLFYQFLINDFGNFGKMKLSTSAPIYELAMLGLNDETNGWSESDGPKEELAQTITDLLKSKAEMLDEYFSFEIDKEGNLCCLPLLLDNYVPSFNGLPTYILKLATEVNWEDEQDCFDTFSRETASFYAFQDEVGDDAEQENGEADISDEEKNKSWKWVVESILYPAMKSCFLPPKFCAEDQTVLQIANLPDLYKVFERC